MREKEREPFELSDEILKLYPSLKDSANVYIKYNVAAVFIGNRYIQDTLNYMNSETLKAWPDHVAIPYHIRYIKSCLSKLMKADELGRCWDFIVAEQALLEENEQRWFRQESRWWNQ